MSTLLVFFLTLAELLSLAAGYYVPVPALYEAFTLYGAPPYIIMNLLSSNSIAFESQLLFPLMALFHIVKYALLARSQFGTERHSLHYLAVIFEATYLVICAAQL